MRITIGSHVIDGAPASSTVTTAALRLDDARPFVPRMIGTEMRVPGLRVYIEAANEAACKTAVEAIEAQFRQANGKTITFYNTTGTALWIMDTTVFPELAIEWEVDYGDDNAMIVFDVVGRMPDAPVSGGAADEAGQRGEIEWDFEIGPNGLTAVSATASFGQTSSTTAQANAAAWVAKLRAWPPTGLPAFLEASRMTVQHVTVVPVQKPNQATISASSYDPFTINVVLVETYAGLASVPSLATDVNVSSSMVNDEPLDVQAGESDSPAILSLGGYFTLVTEDPTAFLTGATKIARGDIFARALTVYEAIEADWRIIHGRFSLVALGDVVLDISPKSGLVSFSRVFSTTFVRRWREKYRILNVDPVVVNRDHKGRDVVHHGNGGPVVTLSHSLYVECLRTPKAYLPPRLGANWIRLDASADVTVTTRLRGGELVHITEGSSNWRFANPSERGPSDRETFAGTVITPATIGDGTLK